jgi:phosphoglycolate phosphatase
MILQCHNLPDADTLASAFAVYMYLKANGNQARIIYSGSAEITKPNSKRMIDNLSIPIEYVREMPRVGTLVMVDCQYGEGNATKHDADIIFIIDHHENKSGSHKGIINNNLGSCSTLIWDLLKKEGFALEKYPEVSTALYYGLYSDTNGMEEIAHPLDKDMRDTLKFDKQIINNLRFNNLTIAELGIAGAALTRHRINHQHSYAIFRADACDQNILGFIGDLALQVEGADVCVVYNTLPDGYKVSVRSCTREVMANEFAAFLASGGGHRQKAGGFISKSIFKNANTDIDDFIETRIREYFDNCDVIDAANHNFDTAVMEKYRKRPVPIGYVKSTDVFAAGTPMIIRTVEGDVETTASDDTYIMIGVIGEAYPLQADKFKRSYSLSDKPFEADFDYFPTVKNKVTGESAELVRYVKSCVATGEVHIFATHVEKNTKVFTAWDNEGYVYGKQGDYIAIRADDYNDVYIIRNDIFLKSYEKMKIL